MLENGGIRTRNENFCHELINYAVRIEVARVSDIISKIRQIKGANNANSANCGPRLSDPNVPQLITPMQPAR